MKMKTLMAAAALGLGLLVSAIAQSPTDVSTNGAGRHHARQERLAGLSAQEKATLKAAHKTAMQDPAVQASHEKFRQARQEFRDAMRAAMLKADPSVQTILDKMPKRGNRVEEGDGG